MVAPNIKVHYPIIQLSNYPIIQVPGIATIPISIDMICECPCEKDEDNIDKGSDKCNSAGDLICGACQCHAESYGKNCEVIILLFN